MVRIIIDVLMVVCITFFSGCSANSMRSESVPSAAPSVSNLNAPDRKDASATETKTSITADVFEIIGTVAYVELEGGFYAIIAEDGKRYDPMNLPNSFRTDGLKVTVKAKLRPDAAGFHMYGPIIEVVDIDSVLPSSQAVRSNDPRKVQNKTWLWESTITPADKITVPAPERYTFFLVKHGKVRAKFDCNSGGGEYQISDGRLSFGPLISTRMACPADSLDWRFVQDLQRVVSFFVEDGVLFLELPYDSGTMRFRAAP